MEAAKLTSKSRLRWVMTSVIVAFVLLTTYFVVWSYYSLLRSAEEASLMRLGGIVNTLALQIDGDQHQRLMAAYPQQGAITHNDQDSNYAYLHQVLKRNYEANMLTTPVYTIVYDTLLKTYAFGVTSATQPYFRNAYRSAPARLMEKHAEGAMIPMYEDEFGSWLSAFAAVKNSQGTVVALVQADQRFDEFLVEARMDLARKLGMGLLVFLALLAVLIWIVQPILAQEQKDKVTLQHTLAENRRMSQQLQHNLDQVTALDAFRKEMVANLSHDLRTPMASMLGYLETIIQKNDQLNEAEKKRFLNIAFAEATRLNILVGDLFELSRLESSQTTLHCEPFNLVELAQDIIQKYRLTAELRGLRFEVYIDENLPYVFADIKWIDRVLQNLLDNALRYVDERGRILFSLFSSEGKVHCKVCNTGKPLSPEHLEDVFDRYFTSSNRKQGSSGLGLAIVRQIINLHHERVWAEANEEITTLRFTLPVHNSL